MVRSRCRPGYGQGSARIPARVANSAWLRDGSRAFGAAGVRPRPAQGKRARSPVAPCCELAIKLARGQSFRPRRWNVSKPVNARAHTPEFLFNALISTIHVVDTIEH